MTETTLKPGMKTQSAWTSRAWTATVLLGLALMVSCSCNDGPVQPEDVHYNVYVAALAWPNGNATDPLFIIDADSMVVIDSIPRIGSLWDMEVSPDGRSLYTYVHRGSISGCSNDSLRRIDIKDKRIDWAVPSGLSTSISVIDNGRIILRRWHSEATCLGGQDLLDAFTGQLIRELSDSLAFQEGPVTGTEVAAIAIREPGEPIVAVNVVTGERRGSYSPHLISGHPATAISARLHPDGRTVLLMAVVGTSSVGWVIIGDIESGETLLEYPLFSPFGQGQFSADGSLAVVSEPNSGLTAIDLNSMTFLQRFQVPGYQVRFVGDSRNVISAGRPDYAQATHPLVRVDLDGLQVTSAVYLPLPEPLLGAMTIGVRP